MRNRKDITYCILVWLMLHPVPVTGQAEYNVLKNNWIEYSDAGNSLYHYLSSQAYSLLGARERKVAGISTSEDLKQRQNYIKQALAEGIGSFPVKTPLNPVITRIITKEGYRVEHIVFESQPRFFVTSSLYLPGNLKRNQKYPAIIYCSGHSADGYRSAVYQHVILNLVRKGFIVFAFDPVGQGERLEYYDPVKGASLAGGPTREHSYPGAQAYLSGSSQAMYMVWDGIRAVDYLLTRKEVDPLRIGITGRSGGGTQSAYIAAFDERIYAAAPENYITSYRRLLQTIGPQDAEQNIPGLLARGLDHADLLTVRAPKPALMITTSGDMFSIQGAIETEKEVKEAYRIAGEENNFARVEDDAGHASTLKNREAMYAFFQKYLGNPGNPADEEVNLLTPEELKVTESGQVSQSLKSETVYLLNRKASEILHEKLNQARKENGLNNTSVIESARRLSGFIEPTIIEAPVFTGRIIRDGYSIDKYFIKGEGEYMIPYLVFRPEKPGRRFMISLDPAGKAAFASRKGEAEKYLTMGYTLVVPDLAGTGEMGDGILKGDAWFDGVSHNLWYASILNGRSITGIQSGDLIRLARTIASQFPDITITGYASGNLAPVLLHAAALTSVFRGIVLSDFYTSYNSVVRSRFYRSDYVMTGVAGSLIEYDLPDLAASLAPQKLILHNPLDGAGLKDDEEVIKQDIAMIENRYRIGSSGDKLVIIPEKNSAKLDEYLSAWFGSDD